MNGDNHKINFLDYVLDSNFSFILTMPFIYSLIFPVILLHIFVEMYQRFIFPVYGIKIVKFNDFFN